MRERMQRLSNSGINVINLSVGLFLGFGSPFFSFQFLIGKEKIKKCMPTVVESHISPNGRLIARGTIWPCRNDNIPDDSHPHYQLKIAMRTGQREALVYMAPIGAQGTPRFRWIANDRIRLITSNSAAFVGPQAWCGVDIESVLQ